MSAKFSDSLAGFASNLSATAKSLIKIMVKSRRATISRADDCAMPLIVLGNGPSLRGNLDHDMATLTTHPTLAVNFFGNAPEFSSVRPRYYVLADPHFFTAADTDPNVASLITRINAVDWPMTLFIPADCRRQTLFSSSPTLRIEYFNLLAAEGFRWFEDMAWRHGWGMPRPRNVLIPSLMIALAMGYKDIYVVGADHSWTRTLDVDDNNTVISVQPHFYGDNASEQRRVSSVYANVRLHEVLGSMVIAFRAYHSIARYAATLGATITNATPASMIDAFPRAPLPPTPVVSHGFSGFNGAR